MRKRRKGYSRMRCVHRYAGDRLDAGCTLLASSSSIGSRRRDAVTPNICCATAARAVLLGSSAAYRISAPWRAFAVDSISSIAFAPSLTVPEVNAGNSNGIDGAVRPSARHLLRKTANNMHRSMPPCGYFRR